MICDVCGSKYHFETVPDRCPSGLWERRIYELEQRVSKLEIAPKTYLPIRDGENHD